MYYSDVKDSRIRLVGDPDFEKADDHEEYFRRVKTNKRVRSSASNQVKKPDLKQTRLDNYGPWWKFAGQRADTIKAHFDPQQQEEQSSSFISSTESISTHMPIVKNPSFQKAIKTHGNNGGVKSLVAPKFSTVGPEEISMRESVKPIATRGSTDNLNLAFDRSGVIKNKPVSNDIARLIAVKDFCDTASISTIREITKKNKPRSDNNGSVIKLRSQNVKKLNKSLSKF